MYHELSKRFFRLSQEVKFTCYEKALYQTLLNINDDMGWVGQFAKSNRELMELCGVSKPTFLIARQRLKDVGLIHFKNERTSEVYVIYELARVEHSSPTDAKNESESGNKNESDGSIYGGGLVNIFTEVGQYIDLGRAIYSPRYGNILTKVGKHIDPPSELHSVGEETETDTTHKANKKQEQTKQTEIENETYGEKPTPPADFNENSSCFPPLMPPNGFPPPNTLVLNNPLSLPPLISPLSSQARVNQTRGLAPLVAPPKNSSEKKSENLSELLTETKQDDSSTATHPGKKEKKCSAQKKEKSTDAEKQTNSEIPCTTPPKNDCEGVGGISIPPKAKNPEKSKSELTGCLVVYRPVLDTFWNFYKSKFEFEPSWGYTEGKHLKELIAKMHKRYCQTHNKEEWNADIAKDAMTYLLEKAWSDRWIQGNFLISILNSRFDAIINKPNETETTANYGNKNKPQTYAERIASQPGVNIADVYRKDFEREKRERAALEREGQLAH